VNRSKIAGIALTQEEYKMLLAKMAEKEAETGKRLSVSQFLRDTLLPVLNGQSPPSVPETIKETKESVSPVMWDTDFMDDWDIKQKKG